MKKIIYILFIFLPASLFAQLNMVPFGHVPTDKEIMDLLDVDTYSELQTIQNTYNQGKQKQALTELATYFAARFSERYFFDWKNFESRFAEYNQMYSGREKLHFKEAQKHLELYPATTEWKIPFTNLKGDKVTSYPYRHLTRQHKADDIAFMYHYSGDKKYLDYIPEQAASLNAAFNNNQFEIIKDGNGAYECYRAGNRVWHWLQVHQTLLACNEYSTEQQLEMIRTFLHTAAKLYHHHPRYMEGNHQTRGMSALAMLSILFPEINGAKEWQERSLTRLEEHMEKEIYADGFQFERTVHYHIDDIENYFYPYQLAKINNVELNSFWETRIKGLFDVLLKMATPNKMAPVLQDDTDSPWAEFNQIDNTMALGGVLFGSPEYMYFASSKVASEYYWYLKPEQLDRLKSIKKIAPKTESCALPQTAYYMMRNGWDNNDQYMIISAGLTPSKKDHQHGDMLGVQAYSHGNMILPNYQVRYYLNDLEEFKNSWVKNVALIDSVPHGLEWKGNKGGSGFGKFAKLPTPQVLAWNNTDDFDLFIGTHNGYNHVGAESYRSVIFIKDGFWIVKDKIVSNNTAHTSQQVWQGHYDVEVENQHARSVFSNGAGLEIVQLNKAADKVTKASARGKGRIVFSEKFQNEFTWNTLLFPFEDFEERLQTDNLNDFKVKGWQFKSNTNCPDNIKTDAQRVIYKDENFLFLDASEITIGDQVLNINEQADLWIEVKKDGVELTNCGSNTFELTKGEVKQRLKPGETSLIK